MRSLARSRRQLLSAITQKPFSDPMGSGVFKPAHCSVYVHVTAILIFDEDPRGTVVHKGLVTFTRSDSSSTVSISNVGGHAPPPYSFP